MPDFKYFYKAYCFNIRSEKPILELAPYSAHQAHDITISWRSTTYSPDYSLRDWYFECDGKQATLCFKGVGVFHIPDHQNILVSPEANADSRMVQRYLSGIVLAVLLYIHEFVVFHASCVSLPNQQNVAFIGDSGAGKSTLAATLHLLGYPCINDDVTPLQVTPSQIRVIPGLPYVKIEHAFAEQHRIAPELLIPVHQEESEVYLSTQTENEQLPQGISALLFMRQGSKELIQPISPRQAMIEITSNTLPARLMTQTGTKEHFFRSIRIAQTVPSFILTRSPHTDSRKSLAEMVLQQFSTS